MDTFCKNIIWKQFGASIDALKNAIEMCPESLWGDNSKQPPFWQMVHHTLFWLDYYLEQSRDNFAPPEPFGLEELDPSGKQPEKTYTKEELLAYLAHGRIKCRDRIARLDDKTGSAPYAFGKIDFTFGELLLYNMRHVQHHTAQLNMILRRENDSAPGWSFTAEGLPEE